MKLVVPYVGRIQPVDARLVRLAEFLGIDCVELPLERQSSNLAESLLRAIPQGPVCLVVNPGVLRDWLPSDALLKELAEALSRTSLKLLVHALDSDEISARLVATLSAGRIESVQPVGSGDVAYRFARDSADVCERFADLSFGPANGANDRVLAVRAGEASVRVLAVCGEQPFLASTKLGQAEIFFLASRDVLDIDTAVGEAPLTDYFSRFVPHTMVLRHVFGAESWRPSSQRAAVIIDDPLLRRRYGHMHYDTLHRLVKQHNFHATIAFIPHNFRRSAPSIVKLFLENPKHLSICFHGNDHTGAELAAKDSALLNTMMQIAGNRMQTHHAKTGLSCDRVMVFPQGNFSVEAMGVLKAHNFEACVNTSGQPTGQPVALTLRELAQPALLRYANFPLFLRSKIPQTQRHNIAFNLFFGRPVLIVAHHDAFERPQELAEVVDRINEVAPGIVWNNLSGVVRNSFLERYSPDGIRRIRAFSGVVQAANSGTARQAITMEWPNDESMPAGKEILQDLVPIPSESNADCVRIAVTLDPGAGSVFSMLQSNPYPMLEGLGFRRQAKAFVRRRLSEVRDNYLSQNPRVLAVAKALQRPLSA
ncbi:MAG: hypothetical protein ABIR70_14440 [Bryobacteraceae bacterium]